MKKNKTKQSKMTTGIKNKSGFYGSSTGTNHEVPVILKLK